MPDLINYINDAGNMMASRKNEQARTILPANIARTTPYFALLFLFLQMCEIRHKVCE